MPYGLGSTQETIDHIYKTNKDFLDRQIPREDASTSEGIKALLAINGGGAIAMLGFMQALLSKGAVFSTFKPYGATALLLFSIGILTAALVPAFRVLYINSLISSSEHSDRWERVSFYAWALSLTLFCFGATAAAMGIKNALN